MSSKYLLLVQILILTLFGSGFAIYYAIRERNMMDKDETIIELKSKIEKLQISPSRLLTISYLFLLSAKKAYLLKHNNRRDAVNLG